MIKLSKKQENVLVILCEGTIHQCIDDMSLSLEDADGNVYYLRRDTFSILIKYKMIESKMRMNLNTFRYGLSEVGVNYLHENCKEQIKDFL